MLLMVDNYDSFTYNLVQYLGELGEEVRVVRNDAMSVDEIAALHPARIVISPGPCSPNEAGVSSRSSSGSPDASDSRRLSRPSMHRGGARRPRRPCRPHHARQDSPILHDDKTLFRGLSNPFEATRYHSLLIERATIPAELEISAWTAEGEIMGVRHTASTARGRAVPPESILTLEGNSCCATSWTRRNRSVLCGREPCASG
jgi:anthranilate synthase component 2